jgi:hypothetical protein
MDMPRSPSATRNLDWTGLEVAVGPYFAVKGLNFFRYFAGKGAKFREISRKFRNFVEISKFLARAYAHGAFWCSGGQKNFL